MLSIGQVKQANRKGLSALKPLAKQVDEGLTVLSLDIAKTIKTYRATDGGYQRPLNLRRVDAIRDDLSKRKGPSNYPPITVANVDGELQCVDGQHRLHGHIAAGVPVPANILSLSQNEAIDLFVRDNGTSRALRRADLVAGSRHPLAISIRQLCKTFGLSQTQVSAAVIGILRAQALPLNTARELDEREARALGLALDLCAKDERCFGKTLGEITNAKSRAEFAKKLERSFSAVTTFWAIGRLCKDDISNLNKLKSDLRILQEADWKSRNLGSLRALACDSSNQGKKRFLEFVEREVLLPAYKTSASRKNS